MLVLAYSLYPDNNVEEAISFWSKNVGLKTVQFQKSQIDRRLNKKMFKRGTSPYGTAHLNIKAGGEKRFGAFLSRKIAAWMNMVL